MFVGLDGYGKLARPAGLETAYYAYVTDVSNEVMAVSLEASCFLYALATLLEPRRILDCGSGFSSYVLRSYSMNAEHDVTVYSVDDQSPWLEKTRAYLTHSGVPAEDLFTWSEFREHNRSKFDLIFYDLGNMRLRAEALPVALGLLEPRGVAVLDDMHMLPYKQAAMRAVKERGLSLYSARKYTLDKFGRFSELAMAPAWERRATDSIGC